MDQKSTKSNNVKKEAFLAAYVVAGTISGAARAANIDRTMHYHWLKHDPEYGPRFEEAHHEAIEALEQEARRRAVEGWDEPVFYEGVEVGKKRRYSDTMLAMLLNGNLPEKYGRSRVEHSGPNGSPMQLEAVQIYLPDNNRNRPNLIESNGHTNGRSH